MPGPLPKDQALRQRRNKAATRAELTVQEDAIVPVLPPHPSDEDWHNLAVIWWEDIWSSPMASEYLPSDFHPLLRLIHLIDRYWKTGSLNVAKEIRTLERDFGLSPLNRRRLEWSIVNAEDAKDGLHRKRSKKAIILEDPRSVLNE